MNKGPFYAQAAEMIPFNLGACPGEVAVFYGVNDDPALVGYDYIAGFPLDPGLCRGYPVIHARIESYAGTGIRTFLGWIQIITSLYSSSHDPQKNQDETFTAVDICPSLEDAHFPFYAFGSLPQIFDAPCRNLGDRARLRWTADTFLTTVPIRSKAEPIVRLLGFRWGYIETDLPDQHPDLLLLEVTGGEAWDQNLPFLAQTCPSWKFQPAA